MRKRNNIFAEAFKWLKAHRDNEGKGIKYQKDLAAIIGVSEDTITRIMRDQTEVTDDFLCKFNEAFDNVFNYQWLRGEEGEPMLAASKKEMPSESNIDFSSVMNALLAKSDETIASLKRELNAKDEIIKSKDERIADLTKLAEERLARIAELRRIIEANNINISAYPFPIGAADGNKNKRKQI